MDIIKSINKGVDNVKIKAHCHMCHQNERVVKPITNMTMYMKSLNSSVCFQPRPM
jgi:hypothetical protein